MNDRPMTTDHHPDCWREHHACAVAEVERLLEDHGHTHLWMFANIMRTLLAAFTGGAAVATVILARVWWIQLLEAVVLLACAAYVAFNVLCWKLPE